jgi:hypothetical protein
MLLGALQHPCFVASLMIWNEPDNPVLGEAQPILAYAASTTLFVLGTEAGLKFIESWTNAAELFVVREADCQFRTIASSRFSAMTSYR